MWKFHMVHHSDTHVDTTTANRHHPGESVFRAVFAIIAVWITGAPIWLVMLYQSLSVVLSQFNHANINIPEWLDKRLRYIIVTPNMHRIHHHYMRPQTDSNYSNIFSVWDRIFSTYNNTPMKDIRYGLDVLQNKNDGSIGTMLKVPFDKNIKNRLLIFCYKLQCMWHRLLCHSLVRLVLYATFNNNYSTVQECDATMLNSNNTARLKIKTSFIIHNNKHHDF